MRITNVEITPISVPFVEPVRWRYGVASGVSSAIVRITTDEGVEGFGEAPGEPTIDVVIHALAALRHGLLGKDPRRVREIIGAFAMSGADHFPYVYNTAVAALEMALLDICGKALGCPIYDLLGGRTNESLEFYWHVNPVRDERSAVAEAAQVGLDRGFHTMYLKGSADVERDVTLTEAIRAQVGVDVALRIDPNEAWHPLGARRFAERIAALPLEFLEQPFPKDAHAAARRFSSETGIAVAANQSAWRLQDLALVLRWGAADVVVTGIHQCGGMLRLVAAAEQCALAGVRLVRHSVCDLGIGTAAAVQVLATMPDGGLAHQTHLTLFVDDLLEDPWRFEAGKLAVPTAPGLGITVREEALQRFARHYQELGEYRGYAPPRGAALD
ncbi:MAG: mandelate racemase/muconate lactonizing enzyme family protein [Jatrophihabitantaceae bacterium]